MEALLLNYLKEKVQDEKQRNRIVYDQTSLNPYFEKGYLNYPIVDISNQELFDRIRKNREYTFEDLYNLVQEKIKYYKEYPVKNQRPYLLIQNDIKSVAEIIALMSLGYSPVLINENNLFVGLIREYTETIRQFQYMAENDIIGEYRTCDLDVDELIKIINKTKECKIINQAEPGRIGIFSSGSLGNPKIVFVKEEDILNNVFKSKFNNRYRKIYNPTPLSSISGLFTNVFLPLVNDDTTVKLSNTFNINEAINCTDVYFPRDFLDHLPKEKIKENVKILKAFIFGEVSNMRHIRSIRSKILLPDNCFVHVYGCTECGGLVSEYEEKDFDRIYIYAFNIENDSVVLSKDGVNIYEIKDGKAFSVDKEKYQNYKPLTPIPCGLISEGNLKIDNQTIGEGLIKDFHTGDIFVVINNKIYPLGRRSQLDKNHFVANFDAEISTRIGNHICATFTDKANNLHLAIKYPLSYNNGSNDYTMRFRNLIDLSQKVKKLLGEDYNFINEVFFITDDKFIQSEASKKIVRAELEKAVDEGRKTNEKIEHFEEILRKRIEESCKKRLGFIPKYDLTEKKSIIIDKNEITDSQLALLLNDLNIVLIQEKKGNYYIFYDDSYFFDENKGRKYSDKVMNRIFEYTSKGLLIEAVAAENRGYAENIKEINAGILKEFKNYIVHLKIHRDNEGNTILIPYYCYSDVINEIDAVEQEFGLKMVNDFIQNKFDGYEFEEETINAPLPIGIEMAWFTKPIYISSYGDIIVGESDFTIDEHKNGDYISKIITKLYDPYQRKFYLGRKK